MSALHLLVLMLLIGFGPFVVVLPLAGLARLMCEPPAVPHYRRPVSFRARGLVTA